MRTPHFGTLRELVLVRVVLHGVRGSRCAPGPEFRRVGGHTSCVSITPRGEQSPTLILDAGTGLVSVTPMLAGRPFRGEILLTHLHWDHVQGLPFFAGGDSDGATVRVRLPAAVFAAGLRWAVDAGMDVVNVSLSTARDAHLPLMHEVADAAYFARTVLVCAVNNAPAPSYPSQFASVVSVAAHDRRDPFGFDYNHAPPVEFGAPGIDVAWPGGVVARCG